MHLERPWTQRPVHCWICQQRQSLAIRMLLDSRSRRLDCWQQLPAPIRLLLAGHHPAEPDPHRLPTHHVLFPRPPGHHPRARRRTPQTTGNEHPRRCSWKKKKRGQNPVKPLGTRVRPNASEPVTSSHGQIEPNACRGRLLWLRTNHKASRFFAPPRNG